jgi:hypothetical protein
MSEVFLLERIGLILKGDIWRIAVLIKFWFDLLGDRGKLSVLLASGFIFAKLVVVEFKYL